MRGNKSFYIFRIIAGAYLIYLGYQLISGVIKNDEGSSNPALFVVVGAAFAVVGVLLIVFRLKDIKGESEDGEEVAETENLAETGESDQEVSELKLEDKSDNVKEEEPIADHTMSIAERISRLSLNDEDEEADKAEIKPDEDIEENEQP